MHMHNIDDHLSAMTNRNYFLLSNGKKDMRYESRSKFSTQTSRSSESRTASATSRDIDLGGKTESCPDIVLMYFRLATAILRV
jgi:hypothetical protein